MRPITAVLLLLLVGSVLAAGTSTGGYNPTPASPPTTPLAQTPPTVVTGPPAGNATCETLSTVKGRIQCRIEHGAQTNVEEESCRGLKNSTSCHALYANAKPCYDQTGTLKDACFKRVTGLSRASVVGEADKSKIRNYIVLLLYDVQEHVEQARTAGTIDAATAADIIARIVAAKQTALTGKNATEIRAAVDDVKTAYKRAIA